MKMLLRRKPRRILRLPDLDHSRAAVLSTLASPDSQRAYRTPSWEFLRVLRGLEGVGRQFRVQLDIAQVHFDSAIVADRDDARRPGDAVEQHITAQLQIERIFPAVR